MLRVRGRRRSDRCGGRRLADLRLWVALSVFFAVLIGCGTTPSPSKHADSSVVQLDAGPDAVTSDATLHDVAGQDVAGQDVAGQDVTGQDTGADGAARQPDDADVGDAGVDAAAGDTNAAAQDVDPTDTLGADTSHADLVQVDAAPVDSVTSDATTAVLDATTPGDTVSDGVAPAPDAQLGDTLGSDGQPADATSTADTQPDAAASDSAGGGATDAGTADSGTPWSGPCTTVPTFPLPPTKPLAGAIYPKPPPVPCGTKIGWPGGPANQTLVFTEATKSFGLEKLPYLSPCLLMRDFNGDGKQDLVAVAVPYGPGAEPKVLQYTRTASGWSTSQILLPPLAMIIGCLAADLDNDGDEDVLIVGAGGWHIMSNVAGTLTKSNAKLPAVLTSGSTFFSAAALDWDRDGDLDIIGGPHILPQGGSGVSAPLACVNKPAPYTTCPKAGNYGNGVDMRLARNDGNLTFQDATPAWGKLKGDLLTLTPHDFDRDGWPDVFLGHDFGEHGWLRNLGDGKTSWLTTILGMRPYAHIMGSVVADMDGDGLQDLVVSDIGVDTFYKRNSDATYAITSKQFGIWDKTLTTISWGQVAHDLNHDGYLDLVTTVSTSATPASFWGDPEDLIQQKGTGHLVYRNTGAGKMTATWLPYTLESVSSIEPVGLAVGDLDGDGDLDVVTTRVPGHLVVFRNDTPKIGAAMWVRLVGTVSNSGGVGAWVRIRSGAYVQERYVRAAEGYGANTPRGAHFGVGAVAVLDEVTVWWPSGRMNILKNVKTDTPLTVTEPKNP